MNALLVSLKLFAFPVTVILPTPTFILVVASQVVQLNTMFLVQINVLNAILSVPVANPLHQIAHPVPILFSLPFH